MINDIGFPPVVPTDGETAIFIDEMIKKIEKDQIESVGFSSDQIKELISLVREK
jgi:hypothetical protein